VEYSLFPLYRYCIPMTDYHRTILAAERRFFDECDTGHGEHFIFPGEMNLIEDFVVPVIVLLTKADTLKLAAVEQLQEKGCMWEEAVEKAVEEEGQILDKSLRNIQDALGSCKFLPKEYLTLTGEQRL
jgi:hypothetical protein